MAILLAGVLVVWLVKPIGDACPDLEQLPRGSTAGSSPSFSPPLTRTCTYMAAGGTRATSRYVPLLDWFVVLLVAAAVAGVAGLLAPATRAGAGAGSRPLPVREVRTARKPRSTGEPRASGRPQAPAERDPAERERARRERAERDR